MNPKIFQTFVLLAFVTFIPKTFAWNSHSRLTELALAPIPNLHKINSFKNRRCNINDERFYNFLAKKLVLQPSTKLQQLSCDNNIFIKAASEPDQGIDENIAALDDPNNDRKYMGGYRKSTNRGIRHMYFGGWKILNPISTFQIPTGAIGQAPERAAKIWAEALRRLSVSDDNAWGQRLAGWTLHYIQDLTQPFHSTQIPSLDMIPFNILISWHPKEAFTELVKESTRLVSNYHYAYEDYVDMLLTDKRSSMINCIQKPYNYAKPYISLHVKQLAIEAAEKSKSVSSRLGNALVILFREKLEAPEINLSGGIGSVDYREIVRNGNPEAIKTVNEVTCKALAELSLATQKYLEITFP